VTRLVRRKPKAGGAGHGMPALVPMIDMLVILVVYMLVHTSDYEILPNTKNISIPSSVSETKPNNSTVMMITKDTVFVDGKIAASVADIERGDAASLHALENALNASTHTEAVLRATDSKPAEVTVMADKNLPYSLLKAVMTAATEAHVAKLSLGVVEKESQIKPPGGG
jgi:biopolymer transport protein TolR